MTARSWLLLVASAVLAIARSSPAESSLNWRVYKVADGLPEPACVAVTVSLGGKVLATHPGGASVSELDGYSVTLLPAPPERAATVYESPGGQLWAIVPEGLRERREEGWIQHRVPEIAAHFRTSAAPVPLLPVRQGLVLFLLPEGLWQFSMDDPKPERTEALLTAERTPIGKFLGMTLGRDGSVSISGERGFSRASGPARNLKFETQWQHFLPPPDAPVRNLRNPHEDPLGITAIGETTNGEPVVVRLSGQAWTLRSPGERKITHAWSSTGGVLWAATADSLWRWDEERGEFSPVEEISFRRCYDVAVEAAGTFWLATSDGLFRYSPPVWRTHAAVQKLSAAIRAITSDESGRLWFLAGNILHSLEDGTIRDFPVPASTLSGAQTLFALKDGTLLIGSQQSTRFDPARERFLSPPRAAGHSVTPLGWLRDSLVCVTATPARTNALVVFDGTGFSDFADPPPPGSMGGVVTTFFSARNGDLWLGGEQAIGWYHDKKWRIFTSKDQTTPDAAVGFAEVADGRIWCAGQDKVWEFDGRDWTALRGGFDRINSMQRGRDGSMWVASSAGLHRFFQGAWIENGLADGLPDPNVRALHEDARGQLWAGTGHGLSLRHPAADPDAPQTYIQQPADYELNVPEGGGITLRFSGSDKWKYTAQERLLYSHRLDEREWSPFQEVNGIAFADLPSGKHYFQVRALDRNGNLDPKPAQLEFIVLVPWYREGRLLAIALAGLSVALFFAGLAWNRHRQLVRSHAAIEQKVALRTRELELAHRELLHSQKMNALGTLAAGIAHDFNNILSIIKGSAQIIEDNLQQPDKIRTRVDRIKTVVEQGSGIVKAMLGFSRDSGSVSAPCNLNEVVTETLKLLGDRFLREVRVGFEPAMDLPAVPASKEFIQQILLNFIFNAAEALQERKQIILSTQPLRELPPNPVLTPSPASGWVAVSVQDFGSGITPEVLPRIFEPFFTTKSFSARRGTGLGLSMVYELAKKMGAGLAVETFPNQGSTFTLILPASSTPAPPPARAANLASV